MYMKNNIVLTGRRFLQSEVPIAIVDNIVNYRGTGVETMDKREESRPPKYIINSCSLSIPRYGRDGVH